MLRTQEAAMYAVGGAGIGDLCEAICLDAIDVCSASRVSIWFFETDGSMVCQRMIDTVDGRIQQGAIIPAAATEAYLDAASSGMQASVTDRAPALHGAVAPEANRLDMLLVDRAGQPAAVFRCERQPGAGDWSDRDLHILRSMAQTLAASVRQAAELYSASRRPEKAVRPSRPMPRPAIGMMPQDLRRFGLGADRRPQLDIRLDQPELPLSDTDDADVPDLRPFRNGDND